MTEPDAAPEIPEFALPDWGTEGAPPPPALGAEDGPSEESTPAREITLEVETAPILSTGGLPSGWTITEVLDIVTGVGFAGKDDPAATAERAVTTAIGDLRSSATGLGADAVVDVRLAMIGTKALTVTAYGTAVRADRS